MATRLQLEQEYATAQTERQTNKSHLKSHGLFYHLYTIWLFPVPYIWDSVVPNSIFIFCAALSGPVLGLETQPANNLTRKMFHASTWIYLILLQFSLHNQRSPISITEDTINKSWRPIPSGRITVRQTNGLLLAVYAALIPLNWYLHLNVVFVCWTMLVVGYNELGGSETAYRSLYNAAGFACELLGGLHLAIGDQLPRGVYCWVTIMSCILLTTIHAQEFRDIAGDNAIGRRTLLTYVGTARARLSLVVAIAFWSCFVPWWLGTSWVVAAIPCVLGVFVSGLTILGTGDTDTELDKTMYKSWTIWIISLAILPLLVSSV